MLKTLFEAIAKRAEDALPAKQVTIGDERQYLIKGMDVKAVFVEPTADYFQVGTLTGLVDYLTANKDQAALSTLMVHVCDPKTVQVQSGTIKPWLKRHDYLTATTAPRAFPFRQFMEQEDFIIAMQTYFVQTDQTALLCQFAGAVQTEANAIFADNGVSQQVTARTGVAHLANVVVPNPVILAPYRTFLEVEQPASKFVFRVRKGSDGPEFALFEADGGNWQLEAMQRVKTWLMENLPKDQGLTVLA